MAEKMIKVQYQIRQNTECLQDYLTDLGNWERDMKKKEQAMKSGEARAPAKHQTRKPDETLASRMKDEGNKFFRAGEYEKAIERYSTGIEEEPRNTALLANRALAYMKTGKMDRAEEDCTKCISLDSKHVKAYLRRGAVRAQTGKAHEAKQDFLKVLDLEPRNKEALGELKKIDDKFSSQTTQTDSITESTTGNRKVTTVEVKPVKIPFKEPIDISDTAIINVIQKPPHMRSRKPLISIPVQDVLETSTSIRDSARRPETARTGFHSRIGDGRSDLFSPLLRVTTVPGVPERAYQFLCDWTKLRDRPDLRYEYLKQFPPKKLPAMFKHSMDSEIFCGIIGILSEYFLAKGDDVVDYMNFLRHVGRFNMLLSMLSDEETYCLGKLVRQIELSDNYPETTKAEIAKDYNKHLKAGNGSCA